MHSQNPANVSIVAMFYDWLANLLPLAQPMRTERNQSCLARTRFPALGTGYLHLLRVLIGSLRCVRPLALARVISLTGFYLIENYSYTVKSAGELSLFD